MKRDWLARLIGWTEEDTLRTEAKLRETWSKTDLGRAGIEREEVGFWRRMSEIAKAARQGRYDA